ncbi:hypothetical protein [Nostoc sp. DSM 114159]
MLRFSIASYRLCNQPSLAIANHTFTLLILCWKEVDRKHFLQTQQTTIECFTNLGMI